MSTIPTKERLKSQLMALVREIDEGIARRGCTSGVAMSEDCPPRTFGCNHVSLGTRMMVSSKKITE